MKPPASDTEWFEHAIQRVEIHANSYTLSFDDGICLGCPKVAGLPDPQVGETIRCYGQRFGGGSVRGIVINGRVYRYQTVAEEKAEWERQSREREAEAERNFIANLAETDRRILALPDPLRQRIFKFQQSGGHAFRRDLESYELFCCEQAALIASTLKTVSAIDKFHGAQTWEQQIALVPGLDRGHSGNTFGMACALAKLLLTQPETIRKVPGAMSPITGSAAYGQ